MIARRSMLVWLVALCALAGCWAFGGVSAEAAVTHRFLSRITEVPAGGGVSSSGPLVRPQALAGDGGALYIADGREGNGEGRLDKFDASSGALLLQFANAPSLSYLRQGVAVAHGTGEVYVGADESVAGVPEGAVAVFDAAGALQKVWKGLDTPAGGFGPFEVGGPGDVAVDDNTSGLTDWAAGDVYVAASEQSVVDVFKPKANGEEEYVAQITEREAGVPLSRVFGVAVDSTTGDVLVIDADGVDVFEPTVLDQYVLVRRISEAEAGSPFRDISGVAVDGGTGDVYVAEVGPRVVDQFSSAGVYLGALKGTPAGPFGDIAASLAVDSGTHDVYVGDGRGEEEAVDVFGEDLTIPDVTTGSASAVKVHSATFSGTVNPDGLQLTDCRFDYGTSSAYGQSAPCAPAAASISADSNVHPVSAVVAGLAPDTTYHFRLQASNANGTNTESQDVAFTTAGPGIHHTSVVAVTSDSATLQASIDPDNAATTYDFQYGTSTAYGGQAPAAEAAVGSGKGDVEVSQPVSLTPGTLYHYRVVVHSEPVPGEPFEEAGPDHVFTTQSSETPGLLDGREWEMVSPMNKHGAALEPLKQALGGLTQAAQNGSAISYLASAPVTSEPAGSRSLKPAQVLATRGVDGWVSRDIATPNETPWFVNLSAEYRWFNADLSVGVVEPEDPSVLAPGAAKGVPYLREADGSFTPLVFAAGLPAGSELNVQSGGGMFKGGSPDLSHIVLSSAVPLLSGVPNNGRPGLYEWSGGSLQLVSVLPNGRLAAEENEEAKLGFLQADVRHAVSDDGSRVIWSGVSLTGGHRLYLRDMRLGRTVQLDAVEAGAQGGAGESSVRFASSDGSKVFFTDESRLTRDATSTPLAPDLYMCEVSETAGALTCRLKDLTVDMNGGEAASILGPVLGAGEDGRYVYFAANGVLAPGAVRGDCEYSFTPGAFCNLYVYDTVTSRTRLVAVLSGGDRSDWGGTDGSAKSTVRASPSGRFLAFMSTRSLTGYDNLDANSGQPDAEVFLYDVSTGGLVCASCDPSGARPKGVLDPLVEGGSIGLLVDPTFASEWQGQWLAGSIPAPDDSGNGDSWYQSDYLSDSGRLFFNAADALVPRDVNGKEDVYEYEPPGGEGEPASDSCTVESATYSSVSGGCVGLISSGTSGEESALLDASESGDDVFFLTASRLAPQDTDGALDVYDAHVCSAVSPCPAGGGSSAPVVCASSDACRGAGPGQLGVFTAPASTTTVGAGNLAPPPAAGKPVVKTRRLTKAQKLAGALRVCRRKHGRKQRLVCEARARRLYGKGAGARSARGAGASRKGKG